MVYYTNDSHSLRWPLLYIDLVCLFVAARLMIFENQFMFGFGQRALREATAQCGFAAV